MRGWRDHDLVFHEQEAIAAWKYLQNSGLRLGSPATSVTDDGTKPDSWIGRFMTQVSHSMALKCCWSPFWHGLSL